MEDRLEKKMFLFLESCRVLIITSLKLQFSLFTIAMISHQVDDPYFYNKNHLSSANYETVFHTIYVSNKPTSLHLLLQAPFHSLYRNVVVLLYPVPEKSHPSVYAKLKWFCAPTSPRNNTL